MRVKEKRKILILAPYMKMGGVETSLLSFLKFLDRKIEVTLLLTNAIGPLINNIPQNIKVKEMKFTNRMAELMVADYQNQATFFERVKRKIFRELLHIKRLIFKTSENPIFEYCLKHVAPDPEEYDLVIDYHGYGFFTSAYSAKMVNANKKIMWIHDEKMDFLNNVSSYLDYFDKFFGVANSCVGIFQERYPKYKDRIDTFYNIIDVDNIVKKSKEVISDDIFTADFKIVTVGRLSRQKGYDIAIKAAKIIKDLGYNFKWFVIGDGDLRNELETQIKTNGLSNYFILLGQKANPFPYISAAELYVQPSRNEGYGLAIAEARILKKPIIATKLDCVMEQITNGENGYLVNLSEMDIAKTIIDLINNPEKMDYVKNNLQNESNNYIKQLDKVYSML
jgi:glycosyltransferase involved in cell wall biosynthesis